MMVSGVPREKENYIGLKMHKISKDHKQRKEIIIKFI
jgi:hypothetical protein